MPAAKQRRSERREWQRLDVAIPVFVRGKDDRGMEFVEFTTALNVSAGGVLVVIRHNAVSPRTRLSVEVPEAPGPRVVSAQRKLDGKLVRVCSKSGCCLAAVQLRRPLLESRQKKLKV